MAFTNPFFQSGKRILVTEGSSGIGRHIGISCAQMGARIICVGPASSLGVEA